VVHPEEAVQWWTNLWSSNVESGMQHPFVVPETVLHVYPVLHFRSFQNVLFLA